MKLRRITVFLLAIAAGIAPFLTPVARTSSAADPVSVPTAKRVHHYVYFGMDRAELKNAKSFLETKEFEGAQVAYSWRQIEQGKDNYDFGLIREDLAFLNARGKKLWIQFSDVTFSPQRINIPKYLLDDPKYNGGADKQYKSRDNNDENPEHEGWMGRRWDPAVQERLHKLFAALGKEFDGRIAGINLAESSVGVGRTGKLWPKGFTPEIYRDAIITNMKALKRAFPKSIAMVYANFMPGGRPPLEAVYKAARESNVAVGGPDLMPFRPFQRSNSYPLIRESAGRVPTGLAVQDGNYSDVNKDTGKRADIAELLKFGTDDLKLDYIFWCTEEPYYSQELIPFMRSAKRS
ncbi:MAG TPA: hypothetical protein VGW32_08775 [Pyrinomonadaceae bacterium]|nr:hypothetical protein [Pyrinomonadaceae bacterium]